MIARAKTCPITVRADDNRISHRRTLLASVSLLIFATLLSGAFAPAASAQKKSIKFSLHPLHSEESTPCPPATEAGQVTCALVAARTNEQPSLEGSGEKGGFSPEDLRSAYNLPESGGAGQTIAIVDADDDPNAEADLSAYREQYGLPPCTTANGCFEKVNLGTESEGYPFEVGWAVEISLDLDMVSAACPECRILLVESYSDEGIELFEAEEEAVALGATVISNSWGTNGEFPEETSLDHFLNHPGIPILFAGGDSAYNPTYPAASPYVISVGGTSLKKAPETPRGWEEEVWFRTRGLPWYPWIGGGSYCSAYEPKPAWQTDTPCPTRMVADVSAVADPETPVSVYDTFHQGGWMLVGGTSASTPFVAGVEGLSSSSSRNAGAEAFYRDPSALFDVTKGSNGACSSPVERENEYRCNALPGYDGPTGNGAPDGPLNVPSEAWTTPAVWTGWSSGVTESEASLHGGVNPHGSETTYRFEYGTSTSYGASAPVSGASAGAGASAVKASQAITGLQPGTTYHYRLVATNANGTTYGADRTFATYDWVDSVPPIYESDRSVLNGVACVSTTHCMVVGEHHSLYFPEPQEEIEVIHEWRGFEWPTTIFSDPEESLNATLTSVSCTASPDDCVSVGRYRNSKGNSAAFAEYDEGKEFGESEYEIKSNMTFSELSPMAIPSGAQSSAANAVNCTPDPAETHARCLIAGEYVDSGGVTRGLINKGTNNGKKWSEMSIASPSGATKTVLTGVSCWEWPHCMATGWYENSSGKKLPVAYQGKSSSWEQVKVEVPTGSKGTVLTGVSCQGEGEGARCVASGWYINSEGTKVILAERWLLGKWEQQSTPSPTGASSSELSGVSCSSILLCTAVGSYKNSLGAVEGLAERWNGSTWKIQLTPDPAGAISSSLNGGVSCPSSTFCVAAGEYVNSAGETAALTEMF